MLVANDVSTFNELIDANDIDRMFVIKEYTKNLIINLTKTHVIEQINIRYEETNNSFDKNTCY
jgi:hypothetical protein